MPVVIGVAVHVVDDFSGLEGTSEVCLRYLPGLLEIDLPALRYTAVRIPLCVELGQVLCLVATGQGCEVYVLSHPFVSVFGAAETMGSRVCSFKLRAA